jgi:hypothetical protein
MLKKDEKEKAARFPGENRIRRNTLIQYFSFHKGILDAIEYDYFLLGTL